MKLEFNGKKVLLEFLELIFWSPIVVTLLVFLEPFLGENEWWAIYIIAIVIWIWIGWGYMLRKKIEEMPDK